LPGNAGVAYEVDDLIPSYGSFDGLLTEEG
jgi:hypothetical protein